MPMQGVPVPKFTFNLIKSVAVTQMRTYPFSCFSGGLCESAIWNFVLTSAL